MPTSRLLDAFVPSHYAIKLDISRAEKRIVGSVCIQGEAKTPTFALNQKYITIQSMNVNGSPCEFTSSDKTETVTIEGNTTGEVEVSLTFTAPLTDSMMGIYPSYYTHNGEKKQLVSTQFETTFAREAFPCVDEPSAKAIFELAIKFDEQPGEMVISNQPEKEVKDGYHYFEPTVRMSSYLLAFVLGDLQSKYAHTESGVEIGVFSTRAHAEKELDFALDIATRCIDFYEKFYHTPYPLKHSYQVALPDFSAGAMENWGLVTYREAYMLLDPDNSSLPNKQRVANVIAHELAHQWFGDLVTMKWWDNLWLNESFANMMEYVAIDALEPTWNIWEAFQTSEPPLALARDATDGVQPVHVMVEDPAEIDAIFDSAIVYAKGARLLVMVRALVGDEALRNGLKAYFEALSYNNAEGSDLWSALASASGFNVGDIMDSWLEQPGYPVIDARVEDDTLVLSQRQFFIGKHTDKGRMWQIPLAANYDALPAVMKDKELRIEGYAALREAAQTPLRLNVGNNTHAIIHYDETLLNDILEHLDVLDSIDQYQLLQDMVLLARAQEIAYAEIVPLAKRLSTSTSNIVWHKLLDILEQLDNFVDPDSPEEELLKSYADALSSAQVARLGFHPQAGEAIDDKLSRPLVVAMSLQAENKATIEALHEIFEAHKENIQALDADIRLLVMKNEMKHFATEELFETYMHSYKETTEALFKSDLRAAACATKQSEQIAHILESFKDADIIKPQDLRMWYGCLLGNPSAEETAWTWMRDEWAWLDKTVGGDMEFTTFLEACARVFHTDTRLEEFKAFFEPKRGEILLGREIEMDITLIAGKAALVDANKAQIADALKKSIA